MPVVDLRSADDLKAPASGETTILFFHADWSKPCAQMRDVCERLASNFPAVRFLAVDAEELEIVTVRYNVVAVPSFVFLRPSLDECDRVDGANAPQLSLKVQKYAPAQSNGSKVDASARQAAADELQAQAEAQARAKCDQLIGSAPIVLFMKGTLETGAECGFSRKMLELLEPKAAFKHAKTYSILAPDMQDVRQTLKTYKNFPTFPQLYAAGELVGGLDICKELDEEGELDAALDEALEKHMQSVRKRIDESIARERVVLFMKGTRDVPQCGFSKKAVALLADCGVDAYHTVDILKDPALRAEIKTYKKWPTFPQLYVGGELVGGLDIMQDLAGDGELAPMIKGE